MKILAPLSGFEQIEPIIAAGPDEVYLSYQDHEWEQKYGNFEEINRMSSFGSRANFIGRNNVILAVKKLSKNGINCFLAFNTAVYSNSQIEYLKNIIDIFAELNCGFIISDMSLALYCVENNIPFTLSTMAGIYNTISVKMLSGLGIKRMIFPRDISIDNIAKITSEYPQMTYEAFLMRNGCRYSDSNCLSFHARQHNSLCFFLDNSKSNALFSGKHDKFKFYGNHSIYKKVFHKKACGLCAVI